MERIKDDFKFICGISLFPVIIILIYTPPMDMKTRFVLALTSLMCFIVFMVGVILVSEFMQGEDKSISSLVLGVAMFIAGLCGMYGVNTSIPPAYEICNSCNYIIEEDDWICCPRCGEMIIDLKTAET